MNNKHTVIVAIGGAGTNFTRGLENSDIRDIPFILIDTDTQALEHAAAATKILLKDDKLNPYGHGVDGNVEIARALAMSSLSTVMPYISPYSHVIFVTGLGGGTGAGATPVFAKEAMSNSKQVTCAVFMPFEFEGKERDIIAAEALQALKATNAQMHVFNNQDLFAMADEKTTFNGAFQMADKAFYQWIVKRENEVN